MLYIYIYIFYILYTTTPIPLDIKHPLIYGRNGTKYDMCEFPMNVFDVRGKELVSCRHGLVPAVFVVSHSLNLWN